VELKLKEIRFVFVSEYFVSKLDYRRRKKSGQKIYKQHKHNKNNTSINGNGFRNCFTTASKQETQNKKNTTKKRQEDSIFRVQLQWPWHAHKKKQQTVSLSSSVFKTQTFVWWDFYAMVGMFALFSQGARSTSSPTSYSTSIGFQVVELPTARKSV